MSEAIDWAEHAIAEENNNVSTDVQSTEITASHLRAVEEGIPHYPGFTHHQDVLLHRVMTIADEELPGPAPEEQMLPYVEYIDGKVYRRYTATPAWIAWQEKTAQLRAHESCLEALSLSHLYPRQLLALLQGKQDVSVLAPDTTSPEKGTKRITLTQQYFIGRLSWFGELLQYSNDPGDNI